MIGNRKAAVKAEAILLVQALPQLPDLSFEVALLGAGILRERRRAILEELLLLGVEEGGTQVVLLTHCRHSLPLQQDLPQDDHLVRRAVLPISPCSPCPQRRPSLPPDYTPVMRRLNRQFGYFEAAIEHLGA